MGIQSGTIFGLLLTGIGGIITCFSIIYYSNKSYRQSRAAVRWPTAKGVVTHSGTNIQPSEGAQVTAADIRYKYVVNEKEYMANKISFGQIGVVRDAHKDADRYPEAKSVTVHYNPDDPSIAVLEAGDGIKNLNERFGKQNFSVQRAFLFYGLAALVLGLLQLSVGEGALHINIGKIIYGLIFLGFAITCSYLGVKTFWQSLASYRWPTVAGVVTYSGTKKLSGGKGGPSIYADISYKYVVNEMEFESDKISFGQWGSGGGGHAQKLTNKYPVAKTVKVHYNPADPAIAVIEPGGVGAFFYAAFLMFFALLGLLIGLKELILGIWPD